MLKQALFRGSGVAPFAASLFWSGSNRPSPVSLLRAADGPPRGDESPLVNLILSCGPVAMSCFVRLLLRCCEHLFLCLR